MSLIDEALKRARMEAAQEAAEKEGLPYPTIPRHLGPRRRRGLLAPLMLLLAILIGVAVGALLARRGEAPAERLAAVGASGAPPAAPVTSGPEGPDAIPSDPPPAATDNAPPAVAPETPPAPAGPVAAPASPPDLPAPIGAEPDLPGELPRDPAPQPTGGGAPDAGDPAAGGRPAPPTLDAEPASPAPAAPPAAVPQRPAEPPAASRRGVAAGPPTSPPAEPQTRGAEATPAAARPTARTDPESGVLLVLPEGADPPAAAPGADVPPEDAAENHVQQVALADGSSIELGGIAWSETGPFALINGRVLGPGSVIGAYTLERIRPGHVVLTGEGRRIHLRLR